MTIIKGKDVKYVKMKKRKRRGPANRRRLFLGNAARAAAPLIAGGIAALRNARSSGSLPGGASESDKRREALERMMRDMETKSVRNPVSDDLNITGRNETGGRPRKGRPPKIRRNTTEPERVILPVMPTFDEPGGRDTLMKSSMKVGTRKVGNVIGKIYYQDDTIATSRGKYIREIMKQRPKTTVVIRDDMANKRGPTGALIDNRFLKLYATCGINRKGVYLPVTQPVTGGAFDITRAPTEYTLSGSYYNENVPWYTHGFFIQDYNRLLYLQLFLTWWGLVQSDTSLKLSDIIFPVTNRKLITTIVNRNSYTPAACTLYLLQKREEYSTSANAFQLAPYCFVKGVAEAIPEEYLYSTVDPLDILDGGGNAVQTGVQTFLPERAMHLQATPFMSDAFRRAWRVLNVHKFVLKPNDEMIHTLSVDMDGARLKAFFNNQGDSVIRTDSQLDLSNCAIGDFQIMLTFSGASKHTTAFKKVVGETVTFPNQMAVSGVTAPCEISMNSKVTMDIYEEDYYDLKLPSTSRRDAWSGAASWFSGGATTGTFLERRMAMFEGLTISQPRVYPPNFEVAYSAIVDPAVTSASGYFIQVESDVNYKTINTQSDPTP